MVHFSKISLSLSPRFLTLLQLLPFSPATTDHHCSVQLYTADATSKHCRLPGEACRNSTCSKYGSILHIEHDINAPLQHWSLESFPKIESNDIISASRCSSSSGEFLYLVPFPSSTVLLLLFFFSHLRTSTSSWSASSRESGDRLLNGEWRWAARGEEDMEGWVVGGWRDRQWGVAQ